MKKLLSLCVAVENPFNSRIYIDNFISNFYREKRAKKAAEAERIKAAEENLAWAQIEIRNNHMPHARDLALEKEYDKRQSALKHQQELIDSSNNLGRLKKDPLAEVHRAMNKGRRTLDYSKPVAKDIQYERRKRYPPRSGWGKYRNLTRKQAAGRMQQIIDQKAKVWIDPCAPLPEEIWQQILKD